MQEHSLWLWLGFGAVILFMMCLDLGLFNRKAHTPSYKEAVIWSGVWVTLALLFSGVIFWHLGHQKGFEFLTGYIIELSLSVDNLFVFLLLFSYFKVPSKYQHRVLFWGVIGALVMRVTIILLGTALINRFHWILYIFGAFLIYTGIKMMTQEETEVNPEDSSAVRLLTRFIPISRHYDEEKFFTISKGKRTGTLLLLVLVIVEVTDLVFAVDSIPAIFGVTTDFFIVFTSNVFAILGLRTLFFLLAGVVERFHYLKVGLALVLTLIGVKMLTEHWLMLVMNKYTLIIVSLSAVATILAGSVVASLIWPEESERDIDVEMPEGFDRPFEDVEDEPAKQLDSEPVKRR
ncbi:MAG: TerC family protein [Acidobacteria bacterium]|nr:TerC family protein [Acidobacteriota bacterium]